MHSATLKKIGKPLLQIGLPVAIAAFFLYKVKDYNWQILTADAARWNYWLLAVAFLAFIALLVVLHPRILNGLLNLALRSLKRDPIVLSLRYSDILLVTLMWCASWFIAGCAFYVMLLALWPATPLAALPVCIGIYAI